MHCRASSGRHSAPAGGASFRRWRAAAAGRGADPRRGVSGPCKGTMEVPRLVAFDLDATLWYPEMYMLDGPPFRLGKCSRGRPVVIDRSGEEVGLIGDAWRILSELATDDKWADTEIAWVSRTDMPKWAAQCLQMLKLDCGTSLHQLAHHHEIYPGSKRTHFRRIHERTRIPYSEMLFLDDMSWNVEDVRGMGVCAHYAPDGLTAEAWKKALDMYARHRKA